MKRLFLVVLFLEIGVLLLIVPWSGFWDRNYFAQTLPLVRGLTSNDYVRGAVSGLGLVNLYLGLAELLSALTARPSPPTTLGASSVNTGD